ncbi:T9SS type A sorting domain-containing protein [Neolewinella lacunae]|nr:T9SS type A sorting domain-containing protein [Neolewinella lacunae]
MKSTLTFLLFITAFSALTGQFLEVSQGAGYGQAVYLDLTTGSNTAIPHDAWDIAFNVGGRSSGILINEGVAAAQASPAPEVELYGSTATHFAPADTADITRRLYNGKSSWDDGAFNALATPGSPFDVGWGNYSPATQTVVGSRVFFVKTRAGEYRKLFISSLAGGKYTFLHGPLDGSSVDTVTVDKTLFIGKTLAYFSFADGVVDLEPERWDLLFTRYVTPLPDGENILDYTVTGVLQNQNVSVAKLSGVDPPTVAAPAASAYNDTLTTIGYDWKEFNLTTFQWSIPEDLVYFVRNAETIFRVQFLDFEGSGTGISTLSVEVAGSVAVAELPRTVASSRLYPNPAPDRVFLEIDARTAAEDLSLEVISVAGQTLLASRVRALHPGLNQLEISVRELPAGNYFLRLRGSLGVVVHHLVKQ